MAGHQWSKVERHPGALDPKRGKLVPKLAGTPTLALDGDALPARSVSGCAQSFGAPRGSRLEARHSLGRVAAGTVEHPARNTVSRNIAPGVHVFAPPLACRVAVSPGGEELHFHNTSRGHLPSVGDSFYEAYRGPDSTTLTGLLQNAEPLRTDQVAAQSSRFSDATGRNDDVHYVHVNTDIAEAPLVKIGG